MLVCRFLFFLSLVFFSSSTWARPEYAVQHGYVSCTMCHVSPFSGGIKTINGKQYATHSFKPGLQSKKEWFQIDFRMEALTAKTTSTERRGAAVMTTTPALHVPVLINEQTGQTEFSFVTSYGMGMLSLGLQDAYGVMTLSSSDPKNISQQLIFGRFQIPFGLATEEHRTYTKLQTATTVKDYQTGFAYSADPTSRFHYDAVATTGLQPAAVSSAKEDSPWAMIINFRGNPLNVQMMMGLSYMRTGSQKILNPLEALSLYGGIGFGEVTKGKAQGSLVGEVVIARGWNNSNANPNIGLFIPATETTWQTALTESQSLGLNLQLNYDLSQEVTLIVKGEQFIPDMGFKGDAFNRQAIGVRYFINSNIFIHGRIENSYSTRAGITESSGLPTTEQTLFSLLQVSI